MKARKWQLQGSSMLYSLMISLLVSALLGAYLMADASLRQLSQRAYEEERAIDNLHSAVTGAIYAAEKNAEWANYEWIVEQDTMR
ncbi:MAG: hypothetical protein AAGM67_07825, partial [Bacteroidota bacterium]